MPAFDAHFSQQLLTAKSAKKIREEREADFSGTRSSLAGYLNGACNTDNVL
jgi:hypothetical protein